MKHLLLEVDDATPKSSIELIEMLSCGIIGLGVIGSRHDEERKGEGIYSHAGAYKAIDGYNLVSICDADAQRAHQSGEFWGIREIYNDVDQFLSGQQLDVISVCTPDCTHYSVLKKVLKGSKKLKAVITEKPLGLSYEECAEIEQLACLNNVLVEINNQRRAEPMHKKVAALIKSEKLGSIQAISGYYVKGLFHIGCTMVDTLRMLFGEVKWVMAVPPFKVGSYGDDYSTDFILGFSNDVKAVVQSCDKDGYSFSIFEIDIMGSNGRIRIVDNGFKIIQQDIEDYEHYAGFRSLGRENLIASDMRHALSHVFKKVYEDIKAEKTGLGTFAQEALKGMRILDQIRCSEQQQGMKLEC